jgi:hypothetical protein
MAAIPLRALTRRLIKVESPLDVCRSAPGTQQCLDIFNPAVTEAFALAIVGSEGPPAFPGLPGHEPARKNARENSRHVAQARRELAKITPDGASYVAESDYFLTDWQKSH